MDLAEMQVFYDMNERGIEALAEHIERGGSTSGDLRAFLVGYLRKEIKLKRGNKRTQAQADRELTIINEVAMHFVFGKKKTIYSAIKAYISRNPRESEEAVKAYLRAAQRDHRWDAARQREQRFHDRLTERLEDEDDMEAIGARDVIFAHYG